MNPEYERCMIQAKIAGQWLLEEVSYLVETIKEYDDEDPEDFWPYPTEDALIGEVYGLVEAFHNKINPLKPENPLCEFHVGRLNKATEPLNICFSLFHDQCHNYIYKAKIHNDKDPIVIELICVLTAASLCNRYLNIDHFSPFMAELVAEIYCRIHNEGKEVSEMFEQGVRSYMTVLAAYISIEHELLN